MTNKLLLGAIANYAIVAALLVVVPGGRGIESIAMGLVGSNIGCMFGIAWFPPANDTESNTLRRVCLKVGTSNSIGLLVARSTTPLHALVAAIGGAMVAVAAIHYAVKWVEGRNGR